MDKINNLVEFTKVSKKLGNKQVLNDINLTVASGEVVGSVGPNGCGKTTLLRLVTGLIYPDRGEVRVSGRAVRLGLIGELPASVGALIESPAFLPQLSGLKNLTILADIQQKINEQAVREAIKRVGLDPDNRKPVKSYSLGMRQRLGIAQAIMEKPNILLFDEPTNGLDQEGKILFSGIMKEQVEQGAAVMMVSHNKEEINRYCDRVFMIQNGTLHPVREQRDKSWLIITNNLSDLEHIYQQGLSLQITERVDGYPAGICKGKWKNRDEMMSFLTEIGVKTVDVREVENDYI